MNILDNTPAENHGCRCRCNHCSAVIEFAPERAGQTVECPHCKIETVLYIPAIGQKSYAQIPAPPVKTKTEFEKLRGQAGRLVVLAIISIIVGIIFLFAGFSSRDDDSGWMIGIGCSLCGGAFWTYMIAQIIHIRANTTKDRSATGGPD